jgi:hypothetical protein
MFAKLDEYLARFGSLTIITGMASGADALAEEWARKSGASFHGFKAQWDKYGKSAGPRRNQQMIDKGNPHMVLAFPGGRGTEDMVLKAQGARIPVVRLAIPPAERANPDK